MTFKIVSPSSESELIFCVDMYASLNDNSFISVDKNFCIENIIKHWKSLNYIRLLKKNNQIVAWLLAVEAVSKHSRQRYLLQEYYCSNLKGIASYKAVVLLHRDLIEYAKTNRFSFVASSGSHLDETFVFSRILEKDGWSRRGYAAKYNLK
jgi:hypothetical protein